MSNGDEDNVDYERLLIGFLVIFLLIGFALIAIFLHMYFKRKDFEKKFLFIAAKVIRRLAKVHVKSDFHVVNLMYQVNNNNNNRHPDYFNTQTAILFKLFNSNF